MARAFNIGRRRVVAGTVLARRPMGHCVIVAGKLALPMLVAASTAAAEPPMQFAFGPAGNVRSDTLYDATRGYGFEPAASGVSGRRFSVRLPEGNYRVTIRFGGERASRTTIGAESRRLVLANVTSTARNPVERSFNVNVRTPKLPTPPENAPGGTSVRLKTRELSSSTWDDKLTLQFVGEQASVAAITVAAVNVPVIYLAGDSTVTDQALSPAGSWGQMLPRFLDDEVSVANHAESGETLKSFLAELRLDKILSTLRAGDWLLIQFGHNDQKQQWPQTYVAADTTYRSYLRAYISETRRRGATPILVTSPERSSFDAAGHIVPTLADYAAAMRAVASEESVALIDLNAMSKAYYESLGPQRVTTAFVADDRTHHSSRGAYELARLVVNGLRAADAKLTANLAEHIDSAALAAVFPEEVP